MKSYSRIQIVFDSQATINFVQTTEEIERITKYIISKTEEYHNMNKQWFITITDIQGNTIALIPTHIIAFFTTKLDTYEAQQAQEEEQKLKFNSRI